jgi:hypothetical protein
VGRTGRVRDGRSLWSEKQACASACTRHSRHFILLRNFHSFLTKSASLAWLRRNWPWRQLLVMPMIWRRKRRKSNHGIELGGEEICTGDNSWFRSSREKS